MSRALPWFALIWVGCSAPPTPIPDLEDFEDPGAHRFTLHPPVVGQGTSVKLELTSRRSALEFEATELELLSDGLVLADFAVLDGFYAIAELSVEEDAPLGAVDGWLKAGPLEWDLEEALLVIEEHFTIEPGDAKMGEVIDVVLHGHETHWTAGDTWASFGRDVDTISVDVVGETDDANFLFRLHTERGLALLELGEMERALLDLKQAYEIADAVQVGELIAIAEANLALADLERGELEAAVAEVNQAVTEMRAGARELDHYGG